MYGGDHDQHVLLGQGGDHTQGPGWCQSEQGFRSKTQTTGKRSEKCYYAAISLTLLLFDGWKKVSANDQDGWRQKVDEKKILVN